MANQAKDTRLWDKGDGIIPFATRSQKLAEGLMKTVGMKESIIESHKEGKVSKTNCINPLAIYQDDVSDSDMSTISDLEQNGLLVYHILFSYLMIGKKTEIQCEHELSTFENVVTMTSYLCVPKDIFAESIATDEDVTSESNKAEVIKEYIEHVMLMANQGYLYAYVVCEVKKYSGFYNIQVNVLNGDLIFVN
jgi:hypothetical protein